MSLPPINPELRIEPMDEHNRSLVELVHPPDWVNPSPPGVYDMVVVGAGPAGLVTAMAAAAMKKKVALIERHLMGGDCLNVGCVPSKALLRCARAAADVRSAGQFGVKVPGGVEVDFAAVMERMRALRASLARHDSADRYRKAGVDVYLGEGRFSGRDRIEVAGQTLRFRRACISTGSRPAIPPIPGLDQVSYLTNETIFSLTALPARLVVIGAGPIGCELAQAFARLGSEVFLVEAEHGVLPREGSDAAEAVRAALERDRITVFCCARQLQVGSVNGQVRLSLESHGQPRQVAVEHLLLATGRRPSTQGLGLESARVEYDARGIKVDDMLRTTNRRIYAAGDVTGRYAFTHAADAMARIVIRNAMLPWLPFKARFDRRIVPWCTYTDPEVARVGATPGELERGGIPHENWHTDLRGLDRFILDGDDHGSLTISTCTRTDRILGATLVARHAGESIGQIVAAMEHGIRFRALSRVIAPYPTQAEAIRRLADAAYKQWLIRWRDRLHRK